MQRTWPWTVAVLACLGACAGNDAGGGGVTDPDTLAELTDVATDTSRGTVDAKGTNACQCDASKDTICALNTCVAGVCEMRARNSGAPCVDGDPCTIQDVCADGSCQPGSANACACKADADCPDDGDKCNGTAFCQKQLFPWSCVVNPNTIVTCSNVAGPCRTVACEPQTGACTTTDRADDTACDDGDPCTISESCTAGSCQGGVQDCICKSNADCESKDDEDQCNGAMYCDLTDAKGKCVPNPATVVTCPAPIAGSCKQKACQPTTGLCVDVASPLKPCDDGELCTKDDTCVGGLCVGVPACSCASNADCADKDDGDKCNGLKFCDLASGQCVDNPASVVVCPTVLDTACTRNVCLPAEGTCTLIARKDAILAPNCKGETCAWQKKASGQIGDPGPFLCDDNDPCTSGDHCEASACKSDAVTCHCQSNADCATKDDGDLCNGLFYCDKSLPKADCVFNPASAVFCNKKDDSACLKAGCDPKSGACGLRPTKAGMTCDDGNACSEKTACDGGGVCLGAAKDCGDGNACTADSCDPKIGCVNATKSCDDANACTTDTCDQGTGACKHDATALDTKTCNADGSGCTVNDRCAAGVCAAGPTVKCPAAQDACDEALCIATGNDSFQCLIVPKKAGSLCDDGDACTLSSACQNGSCAATGHSKYEVRSIAPASGRQGELTAILRLEDGRYLAAGRTWAGPIEKPTETAMWMVRIGVDGEVDLEREFVSAKPHKDVGAVPDIGVAASGHYVFVGTMPTPKGDTDTHIIVLNPAGAVFFQKTNGETYDERVLAAALNADFTGTLVGTVSPDTGPLSGKRAGLIARVSSLGSLVWSQVVSGGGADTVLRAVIGRADGSVVAVGDGDHSDTAIDRAGVVAGFASDGKQLWQREVLLQDSNVAKAAVTLRGIAAVKGGELLAVGSARQKDGDHALVLRMGPGGEVLHLLATPPLGTLHAVFQRPNGTVQTWGEVEKAQGQAPLGWGATFDPLFNLHVTITAEAATGIGAPSRLVHGGEYANGVFAAGGHSDAGKRRGFVLLGDLWGAYSCKTSGVCATKQLSDCDDGAQCTADLCNNSKGGCYSYPGQGFNCALDDGCHLSAVCQGTACTGGKRARLFQKTHATLAVDGVIALPHRGVWTVATDANSKWRIDRFDEAGDAVGTVAEVINAPPSSGPGDGPVGGVDLGTQGVLVGGIAYEGSRPKPSMRLFDPSGKHKGSFSDGKAKLNARVHQIAATMDGKGALMVLSESASVRVDRFEGVERKWSAAGTSSMAPGQARVAPLADGGAYIAAPYASSATKFDALWIGKITAVGTIGSSKVSNVSAQVSVHGLVHAKDGTLLGGGLSGSANSPKSWLFGAQADGSVTWHAAQTVPFPISGLVSDGGSGVLATGAATVSGGVTQLRVAHIDSFGTVQWQKTYAPVGTATRAAQTIPLMLDGEGGFLVAGYANDGKDDALLLVRGDLAGHAGCAESGACAKLPLANCDDGKVCTVDLCDAKLGCTHVPQGDGAVCSANGTCKAGVCQ